MEFFLQKEAFGHYKKYISTDSLEARKAFEQNFQASENRRVKAMNNLGKSKDDFEVGEQEE